MKHYTAKNRVTGEEVSFDWDSPRPPSPDDISKISDQQKSSHITNKSKIAEITKPSFTDRLLTSEPVGYALEMANRLGLNQPWHPIDSASEALSGAKQVFTGEGPEENPRIAGINKVVKGAMGAVGPPLTALGYALNPVAMGGSMLVGTTAADESRRGIEALAPDTSPEVKELGSNTAGLIAGGLAGHLSRPPIAEPTPQVSGPPAVAQLPIESNPNVEPPNTQIQIPSSSKFRMRRAARIAQDQTAQALNPEEFARLFTPPGIPSSRSMWYDRIQALTPEDVVSETRPAPISPSEVPTVQPVRSQVEQTPVAQPPTAPPIAQPTAAIPPAATPPPVPPVAEAPLPPPSPAPTAVQPPQNIAQAAIQRSVQPPPVQPPVATPQVMAPEVPQAPEAPKPTDIVKSALNRSKIQPVQPPESAPPPPLQVRSPSEIQTRNQILDWTKHRQNVTVDQIQRQFGVPGDQATGLLDDFYKRGLVTKSKGKYNYVPTRGEEIPEKNAPESSETPLAVRPPLANRTPQEGLKPQESAPISEPAPISEQKKLSPEVASDEDKPDEVVQQIDKKRQEGEDKNQQLLQGTKKQKELAGEIKTVSSRIDQLEEKSDSSALSNEENTELHGLYRKMSKLENDRDYSLKPDKEKYGERVANLRSVHAEGTLSGLSHDKLSERAKEEYGVESMSKMTPQQLSHFEETLKTERMEKEAELNDLEDQEFEGKLPSDKMKKLQDLLKDTEGGVNISRGLKNLKDFFTVTGPKKGALRKQWTQSGETTLRKEGGEELARGMIDMRAESEKGAGNLIADYHDNIKGLSKPEFKNFIDVLQGTGRAVNPKVRAAVQAENTRLVQVQGRLGSKKINIDPINSTRTDKALLSDYYEQASRAIEEYNSFGKRTGRSNLPEDVQQELQDIKQKGGDYRSSFKIADAFFNPPRFSEAENAIWDKMSGFEVATKLGQSVISNATQPVNISLVTGNMTLLKTIAKRIANGTIENMEPSELGLRSGATLSSVTHETQLSAGVKPKGFSSKMLEYTGFSPVEVNNRILASMAGAEHAAKMFERLKAKPNDAYARRHLSYWLGLDPDLLLNQKKITVDQILTAAHNLSDRTQFRTSPLEVPPSWGSSIPAKMVTLFKNFAFNQAKFMKEVTLNELRVGNMRPLIPLVTTLPIIGYLADYLKRAVSGRKQAEDNMDRIISAYTAVGGVGIISDLAARAALGKLADAIAGPIIGDAVELIENISRGRPKQVEKQVVRNIPVVGKTLANQMTVDPPGRVSNRLPGISGGSEKLPGIR